jgi:hypothetical protein
MQRRSKLCRIPRSALIVASVFLLAAGGAWADIAPRGTEGGVLRFDATLELNAPIVGTQALLCARYWVSAKSYAVAVVWAEPAEGALNFPTFPPTLTVRSDQRRFSLHNQVRSRNDITFAKPIGGRGVFRHKFNNYPLEDIRFAEPEALASRVYTRDLEKLATKAGDKWQGVDIASRPSHGRPDRDFARLDIRQSDGRVVSLRMMDANGAPIKTIDYTHSRHEGRWLLASEKVLLFQRPLTVGYNKRGATVRIGDKKQTYKELPGWQYTGGRRCTVEYKPTKVGNAILPLPTSITVRHGKTNEVLRVARMYNFVQLKQSPQEAEKAAFQFSRFDDNELKARGLFSKYWQKDPDEVQPTDAVLLKRLRAHFEASDVSGETLGEQLKRVNMLMCLDWIGGCGTLQEHFKKYLAILTSNDLGKIALAGGLQTIDTAIERGQFPAAAEMLKQWIEAAQQSCDGESLLLFAHTQIRRRRYWTIARLLEECSKPSQSWGRKQFDAQALRCIALQNLCEIVEDPSKATTSRSVAQAGFASWSCGADGLVKAAEQSMAEAKELFDALDKPTLRQKALMGNLERMKVRASRPTTK